MDSLTRFRAANQLLVLASRLAASDTVGLATNASDWPYVARAADAQGLAPLLDRWLALHPEVSVTSPWADWFRAAYWANHFRNQLLLQELAKIAQAAVDDGIALMPLKGTALVMEYYNHPALRPIADLDFMVRSCDVGRLERLLERRHYRPVESLPSYLAETSLDPQSRQFTWIAAGDGLAFQIDCRIQALELTVARLADLDPSLNEALNLYTHEAWERASYDSVTGLWKLSPEDFLLDVAVHLGAKHLNFRLIWLRDLALLATTDEINWAYVWRVASVLRVVAPLASALAASARWIGPPEGRTFPEAALAAVDRSPDWLAAYEHRLLSRYGASLADRDLTENGPATWPLVSILSRLGRWRPRLRALTCVALPSREYLEARGIAASTPLEYARNCARRYGARLRS